LRFQFGTSSSGFQIGILNHGGRRHNPYVFTEEGVAMLSSVFNSKNVLKHLVTEKEKPKTEIGFRVK